MCVCVHTGFDLFQTLLLVHKHTAVRSQSRMCRTKDSINICIFYGVCVLVIVTGTGKFNLYECRNEGN